MLNLFAFGAFAAETQTAITYDQYLKSLKDKPSYRNIAGFIDYLEKEPRIKQYGEKKFKLVYLGIASKFDVRAIRLIHEDNFILEKNTCAVVKLANTENTVYMSLYGLPDFDMVHKYPPFDVTFWHRNVKSTPEPKFPSYHHDVKMLARANMFTGFKDALKALDAFFAKSPECEAFCSSRPSFDDMVKSYEDAIKNSKDEAVITATKEKLNELKENPESYIYWPRLFLSSEQVSEIYINTDGKITLKITTFYNNFNDPQSGALDGGSMEFFYSQMTRKIQISKVDGIFKKYFKAAK